MDYRVIVDDTHTHTHTQKFHPLKRKILIFVKGIFTLNKKTKSVDSSRRREKEKAGRDRREIYIISTLLTNFSPFHTSLLLFSLHIRKK